jgi:ankyrin repeat protein
MLGTALQAASAQGHDQIVQQLLEHGADINAQ